MKPPTDKRVPRPSPGRRRRAPLLPAVLLVALALVLAIVHVTARAACYPTPWFSEETPSAYCARGYAVKGIACRGSYCDDKMLLCCTYSAQPDRPGRYWGGPSISEEPPSGYADPRGFVDGLTCQGRYCDNVSLRFASSTAVRHTGACQTTAWFSEEGQNYRECPINHYVSGLNCRGGYCDDLSLVCCEAAGGRDGRLDGIFPGGAKGDTTGSQWPGFHMPY